MGLFVEKDLSVVEKISDRGFGKKSPSFITFAEYHVSVANSCRNTGNKKKIISVCFKKIIILCNQ